MFELDNIYPKIESAYEFTSDMNGKLVNEINKQTFKTSAILKIKYYNPHDFILQHIPIKGEVNKTEVNRLRKGYVADTLTSVDIRKNFKSGGKVVEI